MSGPACALVARCFAARTSAHIAHLTTASFAAHSALGDFYDAVASAADEFAECYMAIFGRFKTDDFPTIRPATGEPTEQLTDLRDWITQNRDACCQAYTEDSEQTEHGEGVQKELSNLVDNLLAVIDRALYKLKFLR